MAKELRIKGTELRTVEGESLKIEGYVNAVGRTKDEVFNKPQRIYLYIKNILKI